MACTTANRLLFLQYMYFYFSWGLGMLSFRGFSEITGLHLFLKNVFTKPFALKVMLSVLSLFILHDFLLSSVMWWSSFAFVCKHYNIIYTVSLSTTKSDTYLYWIPCSWSTKTANGVGFAVYWFGPITSSCCQANIQCKFNIEGFSLQFKHACVELKIID